MTTVKSFDTLLAKARSGAIVSITRGLTNLRVKAFGDAEIKTTKKGASHLYIKGELAHKADFTLLRSTLSVIEKQVEKAKSAGLVRKGRPALDEENRLATRSNIKKVQAKAEVAEEAPQEVAEAVGA